MVDSSSAYAFMTRRTLDDLRRKKEADSAGDVLARRKAGERPAFARYQGRRVITVPDGLLRDGEIVSEPTAPEIAEWVRRHFHRHGWPIPECVATREVGL